MRVSRYLAALLVCSFGCSDSEGQRSGDLPDLQVYAALPRLRHVHHPELRAELSRLIAERATPEFLALDQRRFSEDARLRRRFDGTSASKDLLIEELEPLQNELARAYPLGEFRFNARDFRAATRVLRRFEREHETLRRLLQREGLEFTVDHRLGLAADTRYVELVRAACQLEALAIGHQLEHGYLEDAGKMLVELLAAPRALAKAKRVVPRMAAAQTRRELLEVARAICSHERAGQAVYQMLLQAVETEIQSIPPDGHAWEGDRALGMHTYELIRDGYLLSVLTIAEIDQFRDEAGIGELSNLVNKNLDEDELFYLQIMRRLIESCSKPYYARLEVLTAIDSELESQRNLDTYPIVADHLLLGELWLGQRLQSLDRARLLAWRLALRSALGGEQTRVVNPLTGHPFIVERNQKRVVVDAIDPLGGEPPIDLPRLEVATISQMPTATETRR